MVLRTFIALLRGINVGGAARIPMAELRGVCEEIGWKDVQTYIQSGNVVFRASGDAVSLEKQLEKVLPTRFGFSPAVIIRSADEWAGYVQMNPFAKEAQSAANLVMMAISKQAPAADAVERLRERADTERLERSGDAVWIHYAAGAGRSRLTPGMLDRFMGSPTTTRNWRTVLRLHEMACS